MNTRRHPRTLQEAFGPYTSREIQEPPRRMDPQDRVVLAGSAVVCFFVVVLAILGVL